MNVQNRENNQGRFPTQFFRSNCFIVVFIKQRKSFFKFGYLLFCQLVCLEKETILRTDIVVLKFTSSQLFTGIAKINVVTTLFDFNVRINVLMGFWLKFSLFKMSLSRLINKP